MHHTPPTELYTLSLHDALPISVEEARGLDTTLEVVEGMQFDRGYLSPYFVTDPERMEVVLENARILIDRKSTRLNSSHLVISYAVFCLKKKTTRYNQPMQQDNA